MVDSRFFRRPSLDDPGKKPEKERAKPRAKAAQGWERTILLADDDDAIRAVMRNALQDTYRLLDARDGGQALRLVQRYIPDLIVLDVNMPELSGTEVAKQVRGSPRTRMIPIIMLTVNADIASRLEGFESGIDDYVTKPFDVNELRARIEAVLRRNQEALSASPLTMLPGGAMIERETNGRIQSGEVFAFLYIDIDHFKAFNDAYGYAEGDRVIRYAAQIVSKAVSSLGGPRDFVGHVGGDDFVVISSPSKAEKIAERIASHFDQKVPLFYGPDDRLRGYVAAKDRQGRSERFPIMSLTIAIATNERRRLERYAKVSETVTEIKRYLKSRPSGRGSAWLLDRRTQRPDAPAD
ncbi:MAG: response regulator [Elusimicrobia bacterium]|nr:response regulator [Elusimicrobiota bacterium]